MNEAEKILVNRKEWIQERIGNLQTDINLKTEAVSQHEKNLKEIIDALMVLESEK